MSSHQAEEDYSSNIDDQLLSVAKQEGVVVDQHGHGQVQHVNNDLDTRMKLEQIAHAAAMSERQQKQGQMQQLHRQGPGGPHAAMGNHGHGHVGGQMQEHLQPQQHAKDFTQKEYELPGLHLQQYHPGVEDVAEYNIQIPEPIMDSKLKIYPVTENTITAEGNLITRPFPEQILQGRDELNDFIQDFARDNGFGVVIAHSNKKAIYYTCELGGRYRQKKSKRDDDPEAMEVENGYILDPNTKTKKLKCPFSMTATYKKSTGMWTLKTTCNEHNHPQLDPLSNHPMLRKRSDELNLLILDLYKLGTKPSHIESKIKEQYPEVLIKREDIYNEIRGYKRKLKKQTRYLSSHGQDPSQRNMFKKRENAHSSQHVDLNDDADAHSDQVLEYELQQQHHHQQEAELQRQLHQAAAVAAAQHQHPHHHIDDQQLQYQQHLHDHGLHGDHGDNTDNTAAAIAAVANVANHHLHARHPNENELSIDNIDSRLVGE